MEEQQAHPRVTSVQNTLAPFSVFHSNGFHSFREFSEACTRVVQDKPKSSVF